MSLRFWATRIFEENHRFALKAKIIFFCASGIQMDKERFFGPKRKNHCEKKGFKIRVFQLKWKKNMNVILCRQKNKRLSRNECFKTSYETFKIR